MESLKCPSCGSPLLTKVDATEYKCNSCNTSSKLSNDRTYLVIQQGYPCPSCGFSNENGVKFCGNCGKKLIKICQACHSEVRLDIKYCPNCGIEFSNPVKLKVVITQINDRRFDIYDAIIKILKYKNKSELYEKINHGEIIVYANRNEAMILETELGKLGANIKIFD